MFLQGDSAYLTMLEAIDTNNAYALLEKKDYEKNSLLYYINENFEDEILKDFIKTSTVEIPKNKRYIPQYLKEGSSFQFLNSLALKGLKKRLQ